MTPTLNNQIADALVKTLKAIRPPDYRTSPYVHRGVSSGILNGPERPIVCVILSGLIDEKKVAGKRHDRALRMTIYVETADIEVADEALDDLIEDIHECIATNETLDGLAMLPIDIGEDRRVVDPSGQAGIASAEIPIEARYRVSHP